MHARRLLGLSVGSPQSVRSVSLQPGTEEIGVSTGFFRSSATPVSIMPSFFTRNMPRQLPLTPPEFVPNYHAGCGGMPYQQTYTGQPSIRQQEDGYDFADRYSQLSIAMPPMYPQTGTFINNTGSTIPPVNGYFDHSATVLPPMRAQNGPAMGETVMQQQQPQRVAGNHQQQANPPKEEKPIGGVSAKLDYDMEIMTDFVCEVANGIIQQGKPPIPTFRKWVHQVLCATRLPSATILLSMWYLQSRMTMLSVQAMTEDPTMNVYRMLTIALVLGSKFLDDNTFINRSWSDVSGITVEDLNRYEIEWLISIDFKLHRDPTEELGWCAWQEHWKVYEANAVAKANRSSKLSPIDTTVQRQRPVNQNKPLPPVPVQQNYGQPPPYEYTPPKSAQPQYNNTAVGYGQYEPWVVSRSAIDNSPASAPTTGPTTPEYFGGPGTWAQPEGYSRRTMFGYPSVSQPSLPQPQQQPSNYGAPAYTPQYNPSGWNAHPVNCGCIYCAQRHPPYYMTGFGPQAVAV